MSTRTLRQRRSVAFLSRENLESRLFLTGISFATHDIAASELSRASSVFSADLDLDGDLDVLAASSADGRIAWYENVDGKATFGPQKLISSLQDASSLQAVDLDRDGDLDILAASATYSDEGRIVWLENTDGRGSFGPQRMIGVGRELLVADIDGDSDMGVLTAGSAVAWHENMDGLGTFGSAKTIGEGQSVVAEDVDNDGDKDVVAGIFGGGFGCSRLVIYENTDGGGSFGPESRVGVGQVVDVEDMDGDGDFDIVSAEGTDYGITWILWYENSNGTGSFDNSNLIAQSRATRTITVVDLNRDGDLDVAAATFDNIVTFENTDGRGTFGLPQSTAIDIGYVMSLHAADIDGDEDADLLTASNNWIGWFENSDGQGTFGAQLVISSVGARGASSVVAADMDNDGHPDVLAASSGDGTVAWYRNSDGQGTFGSRHVITTREPLARSVLAADLDGDTDMDVLFTSGSFRTSKILWYENVDGLGTFARKELISTAASIVGSLDVKDLDGDGDLDVLSASRGDNKIAWYENTDGLGTFGRQQIITTDAQGANSVYAADVDGDDDMDILAVSSSIGCSLVGGEWVCFDSTVAWFENTDGRGTFGKQKVIASSSQSNFQSVYADDFDGDGDIDALATTSSSLAWYENTDGRGSFQTHVISTQVRGTRSVYAADLDGDSDLDIVVPSRWDDNSLSWYENANGLGDFVSRHLITNRIVDAQSVHAEDLDGDGDADLLTASFGDDKVAWYENRIFGDANDDGVFNSSDLIEVFRSGEYEDSIPLNSTYDEGDWNGDGDFTSGDLVRAFQCGTYVAAAVLTEGDDFLAVSEFLANRLSENKNMEPTRTVKRSTVERDVGTGGQRRFLAKTVIDNIFST